MEHGTRVIEGLINKMVLVSVVVPESLLTLGDLGRRRGP